MLKLIDYEREQIEGDYGKLEKITSGNVTIIGGATGSGKTHHILSLIGELLKEGNNVKILTSDEDAFSISNRILDVNDDLDFKGKNLVAQYIGSRGVNKENVVELIEKVKADSNSYDFIFVDSVDWRSINDLVNGLKDVDGKEFIFVSQLSQKFLN